MRNLKLIFFVLLTACAGHSACMERPAPSAASQFVARHKAKSSELDKNSESALDAMESYYQERDAAMDTLAQKMQQLQADREKLAQLMKDAESASDPQQAIAVIEALSGQLQVSAARLAAEWELVSNPQRERAVIEAVMGQGQETTAYLETLLRGLFEFSDMFPGDHVVHFLRLLLPSIPEQPVYREISIAQTRIRMPNCIDRSTLLAGNDAIPPVLHRFLRSRLFDPAGIDIIRVLLDAGAGVNQQWRGETVLGWIINIQPDRYEDFVDDDGVEAVIDMMTLLLSRGADVNNVNSEGQSALEYARSVVKRLQSETAQSQEQRNLIHRVITYYEEIITFLTQNQRRGVSNSLPSLSRLAGHCIVS